MGSCKLNTRRCENLAIFDQHLAVFRNGTIYSHSYNGRRMGLVYDLSNGAISNDLKRF